MKKTILVMLLAVTAVVFAGCNTVGGLGSDIKIAGEKIHQASGSK